jgi:predicted extracellular nuclease
LNTYFTRTKNLAGIFLAASGLLAMGMPLHASAASSVVISQVYGGGGNAGATYKNDFIELFNRGTTPVSLAGWSVQYASAAGVPNASLVTALPSVTLQPGQYLLVQEAAGTAGTANLPAPDQIGTVNMSATVGKVVLNNAVAPVASFTAATIQDLVGFGSTANASEGSPTAAPSNTNAVLRAAGGCTDTDNNSADFAAIAPTPRNTASPLAPCAGPVNAAILPICPATLLVTPGNAGSAALSASDTDGIVNAASITSAAVPGITLGALTAAPAVGGSASVALNISAAVAAATYQVQVTFANNQAQAALCTVAVTVQAAAAITHTIPQIQGSGATSPYVNTTQTTEGIVTLKVNNGFYLQDPLGDGDPTTSDGVFVFTSTAPTVSAGDRVRLSASVSEFSAGDATRPITELTSVSGIQVINSGNTVTPTNIALPMASANDLERYEGMLVRFTSPLTATQNYFQGRYGQVSLSAGRLEKPTNRYAAGSPDAVAAAAANAANMIILDDGSSAQNPNPIPFIGVDNTLRAGDTVSDLTGVIDFGLITSSNPGPTGYKLQPTVTPVFSRDNPRTTEPLVAAGNVRVSSFNVLNFFTTFTDGNTASGQSGQGCSLGTSVAKSNCRGADNAAEFNRQRDKIIAAMKAINADAFGLMEIQNQGETAVSNLVVGLNAAIGAGAYAVVPMPVGAGSTGDDAIRVAMIYKPATLTLVGPALSDTDAINNRPPMAQTFVAQNGKKFSLIVNHMKSKGSCPTDGSADADNGDGQGCWNARRVLQAQRLGNVFIPQVQAAANDSDVLVLGDLNAYGAEDPIQTLTNLGLVNEIERFVRPVGAPYSYVFDGESGYIDHGLATASLNPQVAGVTEWHINADEPSVIDYNTEFKPQDLYSASPYRASDHDPVIISLNLQPKFTDVSASMSTAASGLVLNRATQNFGGAFSFTNNTGAAIAGPFQIEFDNLPAGVTLANATGSHNGAPTLSSSAASLSPGQSITLTVSFKNPAKVSINYATKIFSGTF